MMTVMQRARKRAAVTAVIACAALAVPAAGANADKIAYDCDHDICVMDPDPLGRA